MQRDINTESMREDFHYSLGIGKANFVEKSTRPDIAVAVHNYAQVLSDPGQSHADAVRYLGKYLQGTKTEGIYLDPSNKSHLSVGATRTFWDSM